MAFRVLIVDDSATTRSLVKRTLQLSGLPVTDFVEASHGREALACLAEQSVDLILADLHMPEMNGEELARQVLSNPATAPIPLAVISAEPNLGRLAELRRAGVKGFLRKPCTPESLRNLVAPFFEVSHA